MCASSPIRKNGDEAKPGRKGGLGKEKEGEEETRQNLSGLRAPGHKGDPPTKENEERKQDLVIKKFFIDNEKKEIGKKKRNLKVHFSRQLEEKNGDYSSFFSCLTNP